jgi:hypothetical protein
MLVRVIRLGGLLWLLAALGCSKKAPVTGPEPVVPGDVRVQGNRVLWTTSAEARGSVRYGFRPPVGGMFDWDRMAYPDASGRQDRAYRTEHSVALLGLAPGVRVYYQTVSEAPGPLFGTSPPDSFVTTPGPSPRLLTSTMIHIGFGDAHLVTMPTTGKRLLIDSGERAAEFSVETYLSEHGVGAIDAMLATHVHIDHLGGIVGTTASSDGVLQSYPPAVFFDSAVKSATRSAYDELLAVLNGGPQRVVLSRGASSGDTPALALDPEVHIRCLNTGTPPDYVPGDHENTNINNDSIVLRFSYGEVDFVIGGDCENGCEQSIRNAFSPAELEVEYFKATHHGLQDANDASYINTLRPRVAFIPNTQQVWSPRDEFEGAIASTLGKLYGVGAHIYVIDEAEMLGKLRAAPNAAQGPQYNVSFVTDGRSYEVRVEVATQPAPLAVAQSHACVQHALHAGEESR